MPSTPTVTPPTLREIARRAGVSHTTVSLSLRNDPSIPADTRERLHRLADDMGYRSNALVSALMSQLRQRQRPSQSEVVGFLTGGATADEWKQHSASIGFYEGARARAPELGLRLEPFWLGPSGTLAPQTLRMLRARAIRGNLIAPFPTAHYPQNLDWENLICVALGYAFKEQSLHRATHHHFRGTFTAFEQLHRLGYQRIALTLDAGQNTRVGYSWLGGYLAAAHMLGAAKLAPHFTADPVDHGAMKRWLRQVRPDAVIGFGPKQYFSLREAGCDIPGKTAFAALDVRQTLIANVSQVAGIDQNLAAIGATATEILAEQIYHNEMGLTPRPVLRMIEGFWVDGVTAPALARSRTAPRNPTKKPRATR